MILESLDIDTYEALVHGDRIAALEVCSRDGDGLLDLLSDDGVKDSG